ncbi:pilus assembly protein TadG-related protein [Oceanimonas baumannii]|uniref:TadE/TadG family type IV pilus assembly protein n=1 Tax=Oceanimonas baumannii TaxID=129578 RepID=UPI001D193FB7|nr:TadE/TadG family type IV pilus assembly protein [Oceanimonas baumannii]MCC4263841.1 pilus assembly protein TadG-related protein [Oceanimonas baumannii]
MKALPTQRKQKGAVLILVTVALFVLLGFTALALDGGYLLLNKSRLQDAVDAAALSGAKTMSSDDASISTHANAEAAALDTLRLILSKDGYGFINVDSSALAAAVEVEFSDNPVPFKRSNNPDAEYIRVRMESVPVTQFLSQIATNIWQVRVSALAGPLNTPKPGEICDVIPLLMCSLDSDSNTFGYDVTDINDLANSEGDVIAIKVPAPGSSELGPGNFKSLSLDGGNGANYYRNGLAGGLCIDTDETVDFDSKTNPGNMIGPSRQGINTRFGIYDAGNFKEPNSPPPGVEGDYYSDFVLSSLPSFNVASSNIADGKSVILDKDFVNNNLQRYRDYKDVNGNGYLEKTGYSIPGRRVVKVPVADCPTGGGIENVDIKGTACMFLNQKATGNGNDMFIVGEFISECPAGGAGGSGEGPAFKLVLFDDSDSGDS